MDAGRFRTLMAGVPAPVTVVTTAEGGLPAGATVSSLASLSLDPPLVSIALMRGSRLLAALRANRRLAVNLLAHDQADLALHFAGRAGDRFGGIGWDWDNGLPRLHGISGFLHGVIESDVPAGDHALLFCRVLGCDLPADPPLITAARRFGTHSGLLAADPIGAAAC